MRIGYGWLMVSALSIGAVVGFGYPHGAEVRTFSKPERVARISNLDVRESSGLAPSRQFRGEYFTHNDSGDRARCFRFNLRGEVTAEFAIPDAKAFDWEDMATARIGAKNYVYFGDVGDNAGKRPTVDIYRIVEPAQSGNVTIGAVETYSLRYPDGSHNCEALMIAPKSGDFYLVTKVKKGACNVYRLPAPSKPGSYQLQFLGKIEVGTIVPFSQSVTGGDFAPNGRHVILRTYSAAFEYRVPAKVADWWRNEPRRIEMAIEDQGEGICYSLDAKSILTTSEGKNCPINRVNIQTR